MREVTTDDFFVHDFHRNLKLRNRQDNDMNKHQSCNFSKCCKELKKKLKSRVAKFGCLADLDI